MTKYLTRVLQAVITDFQDEPQQDPWRTYADIVALGALVRDHTICARGFARATNAVDMVEDGACILLGMAARLLADRLDEQTLSIDDLSAANLFALNTYLAWRDDRHACPDR
jgi:hypothetical protein